MTEPLTPQEHLLVADEVLSNLTAIAHDKTISFENSLRLVNAHISLALARREIEQEKRYDR